MVRLAPDLTWVEGRFREGVVLSADPYTGRITGVDLDAAGEGRGVPEGVVPLPRRAVLPGFVNAHSHAFQRVIRGRTQWRPRGGSAGSDFWSWREAMYGAALALTPDDIFHVARFCFIEMMRTGITAVGEFHYVHHEPDGGPYPNRNELAFRVMAAAEEVGLRITLLNVCYATAGIGQPLSERQRRFRAESPEEFLERTQDLLESGEPDTGLVTVGVAPHSIRAVPRAWLPELGQWARDRELPFHMHVSEQPAEVRACQEEYGLRPVELLADDGLLTPSFTAIHATHLTDGEVEQLGSAGVSICACPTTERDLGDGFLRGRDLLDAGAALCLGTDSHTNLDFLEEMRLVEYHERLQRLQRVVIAGDAGHGRLEAGPPLLAMATSAGARALGIPTGELQVGAGADFMAVDLDHPSLLGADHTSLASTLALSATSDVVRDVWVAGVRRLKDGRHPVESEAAAAFRQVAETL